MLWIVITTRVRGMSWENLAGASQNSMGTAAACHSCTCSTSGWRPERRTYSRQARLKYR